MSREAMQQALEALEKLRCWAEGSEIHYTGTHPVAVGREAIPALRAALEAQQEPVGWYDSKSGWLDFGAGRPVRKPSSPDATWIPVYAHPPAQPQQGWVPVTERLPEKNVEVLICFAGQNTLASTGQYTGSDKDVEGWCYPWENRAATDNGDDPVVTHWMPLPEVPAARPKETT